MPVRIAASLFTTVLTAALLVAVPTTGPAIAAQPPAPRAAAGDGHGKHPVTELVGQFELPKLDKRQAFLTVSKWGFRFIGGRVGNRLTVTEVGGKVRFADAAARSWKKVPRGCTKGRAGRGVTVTCAVPAKFREGRMFIEVWPRLGNDHVDARTLPAKYRMWVLGDAGNERVQLGAGDDFTNGAFDDEYISMGAGDDWVRAGVGSNQVYGGPGDDELAGGDERDRVHGGPGDDQVYGGPGTDTLWGDDGADKIGGGPGRDTAHRDGADTVFDCEVVQS